MKKTKNPVPWLSGGLATLAALLIVIIHMPNTDRVAVDQTVSPHRTYMEPHPYAVLNLLLLTFIPVLCIFILGRRWIFFDWLGWIVLAFLLAATFVSG